jgi:hypothetical protein
MATVPHTRREDFGLEEGIMVCDGSESSFFSFSTPTKVDGGWGVEYLAAQRKEYTPIHEIQGPYSLNSPITPINSVHQEHSGFGNPPFLFPLPVTITRPHIINMRRLCSFPCAPVVAHSSFVILARRRSEIHRRKLQKRPRHCQRRYVASRSKHEGEIVA